MVSNGTLIVDASDSTFITVPKQYTGITDKVDGITYIASQTWVLSEEKNYSKDIIKSAVPELLPSLTKGCITFPVKSLVLQWPKAPADSKFGTDSTKYYIGETPGTLVLPGGEYVEPWKLLGEGTFSGDVYFDTFGQTPKDYKVNVYESNTEDGLYRVENPLKGLYAALKFQGNSPNWCLDAADPKNVHLDMASSGINGGDEDGLYYAISESMTYTDPSACHDNLKITLTESNDNITFTFPTHSLLLYASTAKQLYYGNSTEVKLVVPVKSSAVKDIIDTDVDAPVEFYNLQGQRIVKAEAGQIVIRRQGASVSKIIVK